MTLKITTILAEHPIAIAEFVGIAIVATIIFSEIWRHTPIDETLCVACRGEGSHNGGVKPCEVCRGIGQAINSQGGA